MGKKAKPKMVNCRYPKCHFLHETTELLKDEAVQGGKQNHYYHPDCFHTMQTVNEIRDLFYEKINPLMTSKQVGTLVSTINHLVFSKHVDVDYLKFALMYYINHKPGALQHIPGLHYIVQNDEVKKAWDKEQKWKIRNEIKKQEEVFVASAMEDLTPSFEYKPHKTKSFEDILK